MGMASLTGKLHSMMFGADGEQYITFSVRENFRETYDDLKDADLDITVKKHRKKRSLDANAYAWILIDKLAERLNMSKEEVYRNVVRGIGGVSEIVCVQAKAYDKLAEIWCGKGIGWQTDKFPSKIEGCVNAVLYYGSSTYDTAQMSTLIDHLIQDCKSLGIETLTPDEIAKLESLWK